VADILLVLVLFVVLVVGAAIASVVVLLHAVTVKNRVVAGRPSRAPITWLVAPDVAARLHRRVRAAMTLAGAAAGARGADLGLDEVVRQLQDRAVELDAQLVLASGAPKPARRRMIRELHSEVAELERLAERTVRMSRAWADQAPSERGLSAVRERLELLEGALRELDGVEVAGLRRNEAAPTQYRSTR
jgi:hypothetical protein